MRLIMNITEYILNTEYIHVPHLGNIWCFNGNWLVWWLDFFYMLVYLLYKLWVKLFYSNFFLPQLKQKVNKKQLYYPVLTVFSLNNEISLVWVHVASDLLSTLIRQAKLKHSICVREGNTKPWGREAFYFNFYKK